MEEKTTPSSFKVYGLSRYIFAVFLVIVIFIAYFSFGKDARENMEHGDEIFKANLWLSHDMNAQTGFLSFKTTVF